MVSTFPERPRSTLHDEVLPGILPSLTGLRFWAAALVVAYHMTSGLGAVPVASDLVRFGRTGVTFFFVLSGFVLTWTYMGRSTPLAVYYWRRIVRIWPLHVVTTAFSVMVWAWTDHRYADELSPQVLAPALLLIHTWFPYPAVNRGGSGVSWSLSDEMFFYAIFPLVLVAFASVARWRGLLAVPLAMTAISLGLWMAIPMEGIGPFHRNLLLDYFPLSRVVQFIAGVAIAVAIRRGWRCPVPVWAAVGVVVGWHVVLIPWSDAVERSSMWDPYSASQLFALIPFALLIASIATKDLRGDQSHLARPTFVLLGQASFAWYLIHSPIILAYAYLFGMPGSRVDILLGWGVVAVMSQVLAIGVFLWFERPLERTLRGWVPARLGPVFAPS